MPPGAHPVKRRLYAGQENSMPLLSLLLELHLPLLKGRLHLGMRLRAGALRLRVSLSRLLLRGLLMGVRGCFHLRHVHRRMLHHHRPPGATALLRRHRLHEADLHSPERAPLHFLRRDAVSQPNLS